MGCPICKLYCWHHSSRNDQKLKSETMIHKTSGYFQPIKNFHQIQWLSQLTRFYCWHFSSHDKKTSETCFAFVRFLIYSNSLVRGWLEIILGSLAKSFWQFDVFTSLLSCLMSAWLPVFSVRNLSEINSTRFH